MSTLQLIGGGFATVLTPTGIFLMLIGVAVGIVFGALPGLSATMAIALFLPVTYAMTSSNAMTLLMALFIGAISGGLISAILLHIPGTPSSVATCFDGHPLVKKGQAAKALGVGVVFSFLGTIFSTLLLMFIAPQIARAAINFGNFEFFSIAIFSLTMIATLSSGHMVKGVMAGVMHAPLTGIFLIAEITGGYGLFIPLMIVSVCAYLVIIIFEPHSIYGMRLAREGKLITHHTDRAVLTLMSLDSVIDKNYTAVPQDMTLGQLTHAISRSNSNILPVLTEGGDLLGEVNVNNIRHLMFRTELYNHFTVAQLMTPPPVTLGMNDPMEDVMQRFEETHVNMLPVVDMENHLIGYISRTRMYAQYRQMVADMSAE